MILTPRFPQDPVTGYVMVVSSASAVTPFTYVNGLTIDANGYLVIVP